MTMPERYAECLEPFEEKGALEMEKAIYRLVQAVRQFFKKIRDSLVQAGFKSSEADPCLGYKGDQIGVRIMLIYIDDMLIVGTTEAINKAIQILQQSFEVKAPTNLEGYLDVQVIKAKMVKRHGWDNLPLSKALERCLIKMSKHCEVQ